MESDHGGAATCPPVPASPRPAAPLCFVVTVTVAGVSGSCKELVAVLSLQCVTRKQGTAPVRVELGGSKFTKLNDSQKSE